MASALIVRLRNPRFGAPTRARTPSSVGALVSPGGARGGARRLRWRRARPGRWARGTAPGPRSPIPTGCASSATSTGSSTPGRGGASPGKCQVFIAPEDDHLRTRLTHAVEVAQVATGIARAANLCLPLVEAIALAHDCGHGPAGHASEEAFSPYLPGPATTTRCTAPTSRSRRSTCAWRRSTACATTRGAGPRPPRPRARWWRGPMVARPEDQEDRPILGEIRVVLAHSPAVEGLPAVRDGDLEGNREAGHEIRARVEPPVSGGAVRSCQPPRSMLVEVSRPRNTRRGPRRPVTRSRHRPVRAGAPRERPLDVHMSDSFRSHSSGANSIESKTARASSVSAGSTVLY